MNLCPCGSEQRYQDCCQPFHIGKSYPKTAEQLMRSRYSAFEKKLAAYLINTHQDDTPQALATAQLKATFGHTKWIGLQIINTRNGSENDTEGWVEFIASFESPDGPGQLQENSRFVKYEDRWFYVDGETFTKRSLAGDKQTHPKAGRNDPCWCGSKKKSKKCHH